MSPARRSAATAADEWQTVTEALEPVKVPRSVLEELVAANRILGHEGILDAYGHVSVRHPRAPERFLLSRARSPEYIEPEDVLELDLEGGVIGVSDAVPYIERFIHAAIYAARPEVSAVCHNHALSILPFSISRTTRLRATVHASRMFGEGVPVWDIAEEFGTDTDLLVRTIEQGRSLATVLGSGPLVLMRGHGSVVVAPDLRRVVRACLDMNLGARAQVDLLALGPIVPFGGSKLVPAPDGASENEQEWGYLSHRAGFEP